MDELRKQAAEAIRLLRDENEDLKRELGHLRTVQDLVFKFYKQGSVSAEDLESLHTRLSKQSDDELNVLEKAAELKLATTGFSLGNLSGKAADDGTLDPLTRLLLEDY